VSGVLVPFSGDTLLRQRLPGLCLFTERAGNQACFLLAYSSVYHDLATMSESFTSCRSARHTTDEPSCPVARELFEGVEKATLGFNANESYGKEGGEHGQYPNCFEAWVI
jgi:hypothetical protein